ncbi:MAG: hypothetical protein S4CHLAM20_08790 [Chlamydiia bacterium]|nr:hypothetical protein [Chlamydiia bacterium]
MSSVEYIESKPIDGLETYIDPNIALEVPKSVSISHDEIVPYALEELFDIPKGFNPFSEILKPEGSNPKLTFVAFVFCIKKIKLAIEKLDKLDLEEEAIQGALDLLDGFNEMLQEIRVRMISILGA